LGVTKEKKRQVLYLPASPDLRRIRAPRPLGCPQGWFANRPHLHRYPDSAYRGNDVAWFAPLAFSITLFIFINIHTKKL
jgi:hypothetical protein